MGRTPRIKPFLKKAQENQDIKKEAYASFFMSYLLAR